MGPRPGQGKAPAWGWRLDDYFTLATASRITCAPPRRAASSLSQRELEVLRQISLGASNKEAARALNISPGTVRTHVESVFRKLACSTRAAATLKALTAGIL